MQRPLILSPIVLALSLPAGPAMALGFGKVSGATALGHPLSFSVGLRFDVEDSLEPGCVSADIIAGDRPLPSDIVRARLVRVGNSGERRIRVSTTVPIDEPTLSITVRAGCPARLTRTFVVFADPPQTLARIGDPETEAAERAAESGAAGLFAATGPRDDAAATGNPPAARPRAARPPGAASAAAAGSASKPASAPSRRARAAAPAAPVRASRPVLQLDPLEEEEFIQPSLQLSTVLGTAPAASGTATAPPDPEQVQRRLDQERLKALEASVRQLTEQGRAKEDALAALQAQVRQADSDRYANPVVFSLAGLCAALAAGLLGVLWLRRRDRQQAAWWAAAAAEADAPAAAPPPADGFEPLPPPTAPVPGPQAREAVFSPPPPTVPAPLPPAVVEPPARDVFAVPTEARSEPAVAEPRRPMSAEELIDLEQQVEFFVVLGQDDAAIDLLMGHVRSTSGVSPLPYLKLLEIYRRREEREPYERIRERFNRRFNAYAPEWGVDPELGRDLAGYPEVLGRLQGLWQMPSMAMELLDTQLFRRDAGPTFDVPAYRELLFLYSIARDLAERDVPVSGVDLLLPFGDDEATPASISTVEATDDVHEIHLDPEPVALEHLTLDLDVSTDQPANLTVEIPPALDLDTPLDFDLDDAPPAPRR